MDLVILIIIIIVYLYSADFTTMSRMLHKFQKIIIVTILLIYK